MKSPEAMSRGELVEEVGFWRGQLATTHADEDVGALMATGLNRMPSLLLLSLFRAAPRTLSKRFLLDHLRAHGSRADSLKVIDVYVCHARKPLGGNAFDTTWGGGVAMTMAGVAKIEAMGVRRAA